MAEESAFPLEVDHDGEEADTQLDIESTHSLKSGEREDSSEDIQLRYENSRRYHEFRAGIYLFSNDTDEQSRLDFQHQLYRFALDGQLFLAPLPRNHIEDILDVGCGTGKWCTDLAEEIPHAQIVGFDLSAMQPETIPSNCKFFVEDCNSDWNTFNMQKFDLIHTRAVTPAIKDWARYLQQAYDHLKPGGYIELHEIHVPARYIANHSNSKEPPHFIRWSHSMVEAGAKIGLDFSAGAKLEKLLRDTGYVDVTVEWRKWPIGPWAKGAKNKDIGRAWAKDLKLATRGSAAFFNRVLGWSTEQFEVVADGIRDEIDSGKVYMWVDMCFAYARKPS